MDLDELWIELLDARDRVVHVVPGQVLAVGLVLVPSEQKKKIVELHHEKELLLQAVGLFYRRIYSIFEHPLGHDIPLFKAVYMCRGVSCESVGRI